jgi:hypothetical protein
MKGGMNGEKVMFTLEWPYHSILIHQVAKNQRHTFKLDTWMIVMTPTPVACWIRMEICQVALQKAKKCRK